MTKKSSVEEETLFRNIEDVARDLSNRIGDLNSFLDDLKSVRQARVLETQTKTDKQGGDPSG